MIPCTTSGTGTEDDPFVICNSDDLNNIRNNLDANYILGKNIDISCYIDKSTEEWLPIGNENNIFSGNFNGQNNTIKGLFINRPDTSYVGLFGHTSNSKIYNLNVIDANVIGNNYVGILTGNSEYTNLSNISTSGDLLGNTYIGGVLGFFLYSDGTNLKYDILISYNQTFSRGAGGIFGVGYFVNLINSSSFVDINFSTYAGGLIGYGECITISDSYSKRNIIVENNAGGIAGGDVDLTIEKSYSLVSITGELIGGLIGESYNVNISNSYSLSDLNVTGNDAGGISGYILYPINLSNLYYAGKITNNDYNYVGGLVGYGEGFTINDSYWDVNVSGQLTIYDNQGEGKTTSKMLIKSTYNNWDFVNIWRNKEGISYPFLKISKEYPIPD
jgi:hypothetical protein